MRTMRITAAVAGVVMMAGLTACGGKDGGSDKAGGSAAQGPLALLQAASQKTGQENSAKVESTQKNGEATTLTKGSMDWSNGMRMNVEITRQGSTQGVPGGGKPMTALYTPQAMFMKLGLGGKPWVKYDYDALAKQSPVGALLKDQMQNNNPPRSVAMIIASGQAKKVGTEDVRGVQATRFSATMDAAGVARMQASKDFSEKDMKAYQDALKASGTKNVTIDLWIDKNNLLVKKLEKVENKMGASENTTYYSDYGTKADVQEPPADQTSDGTKMGGLG